MLDEGQARPLVQGRSGAFVRLRVRDSGQGIPPVRRNLNAVPPPRQKMLDHLLVEFIVFRDEDAQRRGGWRLGNNLLFGLGKVLRAVGRTLRLQSG